ncbi:MAG TPA: hypothetical protein VFZ48_01070 [Candidatus Saccharimonadales bacterium]
MTDIPPGRHTTVKGYMKLFNQLSWACETKGAITVRLADGGAVTFDKIEKIEDAPARLVTFRGTTSNGREVEVQISMRECSRSLEIGPVPS